MVLFGSKFWIPEQFRTLTIAVLGPIATETRRHSFSIPATPFICNHVSLASRLIVVSTAHLYATAFFVCNRRILSSIPSLPFICIHVFSRFSFNCCMESRFLHLLYATTLFCMQQLFLVIDLINVKTVRMSSLNSTINSWTSPIKGCFSCP